MYEVPLITDGQAGVLPDRYRLYGGMGSPYSMKMRAILRYRRLPFDWVIMTRELRAQTPHEGPNLIPVLEYPEDHTFHIDSTPLAYALEARHPGMRSIVPEDPALAFINDLIEDFGDEWCTKMMFHYRWAREVDQLYSSQQIISDNAPGLEEDQIEAMAKAICERQVGRMPLVGCTEENAPTIEESFHTVLGILAGHLRNGLFLLGTRPGLGDFGLFGQFRILSQDHTPGALMRDGFPRVFDWFRRLDDASGVEGDWFDANDPLPEGVMQLLSHVGKTYLPFLKANTDAMGEGEENLTLEILGRPWSQATFRYQVKCHDYLKKKLAALEGESLLRTRSILGDTGCLDYLT